MHIENFDDLYSNHYAEIFRFCFRMIKNRQDAEELTNETFVKAYYHYDPTEKASFRTYIYKIAKNLCIDLTKSKGFKQKERTVTLDEHPLYDGINGKLEQEELVTVLNYCLEKLKDEERLAVRFYHIEDFALQEIADIIGKSINTVKNRIKSGLQKLKTCLKKRGIDQFNSPGRFF